MYYSTSECSSIFEHNEKSTQVLELTSQFCLKHPKFENICIISTRIFFIIYYNKDRRVFISSIIKTIVCLYLL